LLHYAINFKNVQGEKMSEVIYQNHRITEQNVELVKELSPLLAISLTVPRLDVTQAINWFLNFGTEAFRKQQNKK
jgi:hypothetical protein